MGELNSNSKLDPFIAAEKQRVARLFSLVGGFFTLLFAITSLLGGHLGHSVFLFLLTALVLSNLLFLKKSRHPKVHNRVVALSMGLLFIELLYTGGVNASGMLWFYLYPPVAYFMLGSRDGTIAITLVVLVSSIYLAVEGVPSYLDPFPVEFIERLLASLLTITILSYIYEQSRETRYEEILRLSKELEHQAGTDHLSQLHNRFRMNDIIEQEFARFTRSEEPFSLIMGDIDYFKRINDTMGHQEGDAVIRDVSRLIRSHMRKQDAAARWGGEEFLLLLPSTNNSSATAMAERLRRNVENAFRGNDRPAITMSFGIATALSGQSLDEILKRADENLYLAKRRGRNCIVV